MLTPVQVSWAQFQQPTSSVFDLISTEIFHCVLVLIGLPAHVLTLFDSGESFTKADLDTYGTGTLRDLIPNHEACCLVTFPCCIPILDGVETMCKGTIIKGHSDAVDSNFPSSSFWLTAFPAWSLEIQLTDVAAKTATKKKFPVLSKHQHRYMELLIPCRTKFQITVLTLLSNAQ
jgi:hypothetical protein